MHKKGKFSFLGIIISMLVVGLFFGLIGASINMLGENYDITGFDVADINTYDKSQNLSSDINDIYQKVDKVTSDPGWFDFFAGIFNTILTPFKFMYRTFTTLIGLTSSAVTTLNLLDIFVDFFVTLITTLVIVGLIMLRTYMNR